MKSLKGTRTAENLMKAFAGESQARNRYIYGAKEARKAGYEQIANIFQETAFNEEQHAKIFFEYLSKELNGEAIEINEASYPVALGDTLFNLEEARRGEHEENSMIYPEFAKVADEEGFPAIANSFRKVGEVEVHHEQRFNKLVNNMKEEIVFKRPEPTTKWICLNCGYIHEGQEAPKVCPVCRHPQAYFQLEVEAY